MELQPLAFSLNMPWDFWKLGRIGRAHLSCTMSPASRAEEVERIPSRWHYAIRWPAYCWSYSMSWIGSPRLLKPLQQFGPCGHRCDVEWQERITIHHLAHCAPEDWFGVASQAIRRIGQSELYPAIAAPKEETATCESVQLDHHGWLHPQ